MSELTPVAMSAHQTHYLNDLQYRQLTTIVSDRLQLELNQQLFRTTADTQAMWDAYLAAYSESDRAHYDCNTCRSFVINYGGLAYINDNNELVSAVWPEQEEEVDNPLTTFIRQCFKLVSKATITGPFFAKSPMVGIADRGGYHHLHLKVPYASQVVADGKKRTATYAQLRTNYEVLGRSIGRIPFDALSDAAALFEYDKTLSQYPKQAAQIKAYHALRLALSSTQHRIVKDNMLWAIAADRPDVALIANTTAGQFILDLKMDGEVVAKRKFESMTDGLVYQRPQAPTTVGNLERAEKLIAELGMQRSLLRRTATVNDIVEWEWKPPVVPTQVTTKPEGVFGTLKAEVTSQADAAKDIQGGAVSWAVFKRDVLSKVTQMEFLTPNHGPFCGFTAAVDLDAPPILRWDSKERRNHASVFQFHGGSTAPTWGLKSNTWSPVIGICAHPSRMFGGGYENEGPVVPIAVTAGRVTGEIGLCLFPEVLVRELYEVRATIEAFSNLTPLELTEDSVVGIPMSIGLTVRVKTTDNRQVVYKIDRLE